MNAAGLTTELKRRLADEGFDAIGVAAVEPPPERDVAALATWLDGGRHATMEWMRRTREQRADPRRLLPGCRHVVVAAMSYWPGTAAARTPAGRGRVALYAQGRDYHKVMGRKLRTVAAWLEQASGAPARAFVDTGPVLERAWAQRAGLGWIGKNANLLTSRMGSWLLLGELLSAAELIEDGGPHAEHCGSCTACLDACPTGAIVADGVVDSNACISYWTIEHRGAVPAARRADPGEWLFGCDVCQEVCPWNESHALPVDPRRFERRDDLNGLDAVELLGLDEAEFRRRYSGTPLMRAKWEGMRRNACLVLAGRSDAASEAALRSALDDGDEVVREHAAWALERRSGGRSPG